MPPCPGSSVDGCRVGPVAALTHKGYILDRVHGQVVHDQDGAGVRGAFDSGLRAFPFVAGVLHDAQVIVAKGAGGEFRLEVLRLHRLPRQIAGQLLSGGAAIIRTHDHPVLLAVARLIVEAQAVFRVRLELQPGGDGADVQAVVLVKRLERELALDGILGVRRVGLREVRARAALVAIHERPPAFVHVLKVLEVIVPARVAPPDLHDPHVVKGRRRIAAPGRRPQHHLGLIHAQRHVKQHLNPLIERQVLIRVIAVVPASVFSTCTVAGAKAPAADFTAAGSSIPSSAPEANGFSLESSNMAEVATSLK